MKRHRRSAVHRIAHRSVTWQFSVTFRVRIQSFCRRRIRTFSVHSSVTAVVIVGRRASSPAALKRARPTAQGHLLGRGRRHGDRVSPAVVADARAADQSAEDAAETLTEDAVNDEVGRRVYDDQQVAEVRGVDEWIWTSLVLWLLDRFEDG